jgi:hypothetical protein
MTGMVSAIADMEFLFRHHLTSGLLDYRRRSWNSSKGIAQSGDTALPALLSAKAATA